jgi:dUTP pyrophosphatase
MPRSSISKTPLLMRNSIGLIDSGYVGNIKAPLYNTSSEPFELKRGERYVQLVNSNLDAVSLQLVDKHRDTSRGQGGFGST